MNLMSSMAKTLVGSAIAIVIVAPAWLTGRMWYFCAVSAGISLMTDGVDLELRQVDRRNADCWLSSVGDFFVGDEARA